MTRHGPVTSADTELAGTGGLRRGPDLGSSGRRRFPGPRCPGVCMYRPHRLFGHRARRAYVVTRAGAMRTAEPSNVTELQEREREREREGGRKREREREREGAEREER